MTTNTQIAGIFNNIGNMLEILGENPFKIRAYKNASKTVRVLDEDINEIAQKDQLTDIKGIGKELAKKIREYAETGKIEYYEELKLRVPEELLKIKNIQGIGPKLLQTLFNDFNVRNISDLENTISEPEFINSRGVGNKIINEIKVGIKLFKSHINKINLGFALPTAEYFKKELTDIPYVNMVEIVGDLRRGKETVETIDLVICSEEIKKTADKISKFPIINKDKFIIKQNHLSLTLDSKMPVEIDIASEENFSSLKFFNTGTEKHTTKIKGLYKNKGIDLQKEKFNTEHDIYSKLELEYIPPELREDCGEIELALKFKLPNLIELIDIKGDLHTHSTWSDGKSTIKEMAESAKKLDYEYIAITDHSISSRIANGLDIVRLKEKKKEIQRIDADIEDIKIIFGSEVDIKPDGTLDYPDEILQELDMVVASVHSNFKMEEAEMTQRIVNALSNPFVCALGHPTGRLIGERNPYKMDINAVIETAAKYGKALEVNSSYMRLDLKDEHIKMAVDKGVKLVISTDAHNTDQLLQMKYGISTARRGWADKSDVINTKPLNQIMEWLNNFK